MAQYLKKDCELGYIEDSAEIDYLKFNNLRHTVLGCMLGDFDENGNYVISPDIRKELIQMKKYIVETMDNIEICLSELKLDKQISFMVVFEGNRATLSLIEKMSYEANFKINSGTYSNINEYLLDEVETSGAVNRNAIYQRWNIGEFGGNVLDIFSCDETLLEKYFGIVNRFKYLLQANKIMLEKEEQIEEIEAEYSNRVFEILKQFPEMRKAVEKTLADSVKEKQGLLSPEKPNFAKTFNEILDKALEEHSSLLTEEQKTDFDYQMHNIRVDTNIKKKDVIDVRINKIETDLAVIANTEEQDIKQQTSTIFTINTGNAEEYKSVQECGVEFAEAHRQNQERKNSKQVSPESEMEALFSYLYAKGILKREKKEEVKQEQQTSLGSPVAPVAQAGAKAPAKAPEKAPAGGRATASGRASSPAKNPQTQKPAQSNANNLVQRAGQREEKKEVKTEEKNNTKKKKRVVVVSNPLTSQQTPEQTDDRRQVAPNHQVGVLTGGATVNSQNTQIQKGGSAVSVEVSKVVEVQAEEIHSL